MPREQILLNAFYLCIGLAMSVTCRELGGEVVIVVEVGDVGKGIEFVHVGMADIVVVVCVMVAFVATVGIVVFKGRFGSRKWRWWWWFDCSESGAVEDMQWVGSDIIARTKLCREAALTMRTTRLWDAFFFIDG